MRFCAIDSRRYARFERLGRQQGLRHAFSTRPDDVSARAEGSAARRRRMAIDLELDADAVAYCLQVHRTELAVIEGSTAAGPCEGVDGLLTVQPGTTLMTFSADCPLVLAYDPVRRAVGMVHASWRCTVAGATRGLIEAMRRSFGCDPKNILAGVGPGAGPCCYEVGADVREAAASLEQRDAVFSVRGGRLFFDLWSANRAQLLAAGVRAENVETAGICTLCRNDLFYSYRIEGAGCGHFGLMAGLRSVEP